MLLVKTYIAASPIDNFGLFADEFIPEGSELWRFTPGYDLEVSLTEFEKQPGHVRDFFKHYGYLDFHLNCYILCFDNARFINHSENPNSRPDYCQESHGVDIAIRDISKGEEITSDYRSFER
jgi:SET domain-containing protein